MADKQGINVVSSIQNIQSAGGFYFIFIFGLHFDLSSVSFK
jgi:hypothetical protein